MISRVGGSGAAAVTSLPGAVAVVTGGGRGMGRTSALAMAREGASIAVADINLESAEQVAQEIAGAGGRAVAIHVDVSDEASVSELAARTKSELGRLDILHNNAALLAPEFMSRDGEVAELDLEVWERAFAVNTRGTLLGCKHVIP
jgi:NAD(P)-dependent dehydrogenase (short-subunit alcohol dehydrogenase family)